MTYRGDGSRVPPVSGCAPSAGAREPCCPHSSPRSHTPTTPACGSGGRTRCHATARYPCVRRLPSHHDMERRGPGLTGSFHVLFLSDSSGLPAGVQLPVGVSSRRAGRKDCLPRPGAPALLYWSWHWLVFRMPES